jgi:hypothetical protein
MALPVLEKTWQFQVSQASAGNLTLLVQNQNLLYGIKTALIGGGSWTNSVGGAVGSPTGLWTVVSSCDSVNIPSASDQWSAANKLIWGSGASARSWIVFKQTGISSNFQMLFHCGSAASNNLLVSCSPNAGFTGGATNAPPTATDEIVVLPASTTWGASSSTSVASRWNVILSNDGCGTRISIWRGGICTGFALIDKAVDAVNNWTYPFVAGWKGNATATAAATVTNFCGGTTPISVGYAANKTMNMYLTCEAIGTGNSTLSEKMGVSPSDLGDGYGMFPVGLYSDTLQCRGRHGRIPDIWYGAGGAAGAGAGDGDTYPVDGSNKFCNIGAFVLPWDTTAPVTS